MKEKTPQEKKAQSYAKDRRNGYGANDKASRNSIPKRKAVVNRSYRKNISDALKGIVGRIDLEHSNEIEHAVRSVKRSDWKKYPDIPLGGVVRRNLESRESHAGQGKSAAKKLREFAESLEIETEEIESEKGMATAKMYPWISANAQSCERAIDKLKHLMTVAKMNGLGSKTIRVQIDGEFIMPTLTK